VDESDDVDGDEEWQGLACDLFCEAPIVPVGCEVFTLPIVDGTIRVFPRRDTFARSAEQGGGVRGVGADDGRVTGALLWDSAVLLAAYLVSRSANALANRRCIELGAGLGLVGLVAASLGCHATLTDRDEVLPLLIHGVAANGLGSNTHVAALEWGVDLDSAAQRLGAPFDLILMSDVVYEASLATVLVDTIAALAGSGSEVLFAQDAAFGRRVAFEAFEASARRRFSWELLPVEATRGGPTKDSVSLVRMRLLVER